MMRAKALMSVAALVLVGACGGQSSGRSDSGSVSGDAMPVTPGPVSLDITVINGEVNPRGARLNVKVGQEVRLTVHTDVDEELHIHTDPEKTVAVAADSNERVSFTVARPGRVAVELHHLDVVVAEVLARP